MSVEENKKSAYRCFEEVWNKGDLSVIPEVISPDYVGHNVPQEITGLDSFEKMVKDALAATPDLHYAIEDVFGEGDKLTITATITGTQAGEPFKIAGVLINRYVDGKCVEATAYTKASS